jgi:uncharacterized protein (TIGR03118 family)
MAGLINKFLGSRGRRPEPRCRLSLESLEDRCLLSGTVLQTNLVSDLAGVAAVTDPNLVNPWGISESPSTAARPGSAFWISDNNSGQSTLYNVPGANNTPVSINSLVVSIPTPVDPLGASGAPTGTVFNIDGGQTGGFVIKGLSKTGAPASGSAAFLFATEDGTIVAWNPGVNPAGFDPAKAGTYAILAVDNSGNNFTQPDPALQTGAVYKGLAIATDAGGATRLYAANFRSGHIDVFGPDFKPATNLAKGAFTDPTLPKGYAPFNVQELGGKIYVTYALQNATKHDDVEGEGHGFVDVFNLDGSPGLAHGKERLVSRGDLNSPWGLAIAPASFGKLAGALLVGNFGDGLIHAYNAANGTPMGALTDPDGEPIQIDGLWALKVGNDGNGGNSNTVYFTAGLDHEMHGLFGSLTPVAPGTPEGPAEAQKVQAAVDVFQIDLQQLIKDISSGAAQATIRQDFQTVHDDFVQLVRSELGFVADTHADMSPKGHHGESGAREFEEALDALFAALGGHDRR